MRKFFLISGALSLFAVGCATPERVCQAGVDQVCERQFECQTEAARNSEQFKATFGNSVSDCKTKLSTTNNCAGRKEDNDNCTGTSAGKTFNLDKASACSDARADLSCADYLTQFADATKSPAVCAEVCR
jgi:hypothetical protein